MAPKLSKSTSHPFRFLSAGWHSILRVPYVSLSFEPWPVSWSASTRLITSGAACHTAQQAVTYGQGPPGGAYVTDSVCLLPLILPNTAGFLPVSSGPSLSAVLVLRCSGSVPAAKGTARSVLAS